MIKKNANIDAICALRQCHDVCLESLSLHCMKMGGDYMAREHIRRMESCIELCNLTANFILYHGPLTQELCDLTASVCRQCAASCSGMEDTKMNTCLRACEEAAQSCLNESYHLRVLAA